MDSNLHTIHAKIQEAIYLRADPGGQFSITSDGNGNDIIDSVLLGVVKIVNTNANDEYLIQNTKDDNYLCLSRNEDGTPNISRDESTYNGDYVSLQWGEESRATPVSFNLIDVAKWTHVSYTIDVTLG